MPGLDDPQSYAELDPSGLGARIASSPTLCRDAWVTAQAFPLPSDFRRTDRILVLGMGGSAMGGDLLAGLQEAQGGVAVDVHRGYGRQSPPNPATLVIVSSYSGNTEETLTAFDSTWRQGTNALALTHGGALVGRARVLGIPVFLIPTEGEPRSVMAFSLFSMLGFLQKLSLAPDRSGDVAETIRLMQEAVTTLSPNIPTSRNAAKALAMKTVGKTALILGAEFLEPVARRWKTQIAENAKAVAFADALPEFDHNTIEGLRFPKGAAEDLLAIILQSASYHPRNVLRCDLTQKVIVENGAFCESYTPRGKSCLAQLMSAVLFGDYFSYYLAIANGINPSLTPNLDRFKKLMAEG